jgi:hypothetical protein
MDKLISKLEKVSLSNNDLDRLCDYKVNVVTYDELPDYETLDQLLGPYGACILLYMTDLNFGHWTAIIKINNRSVEFFDPYGYFPDTELQFIPNDIKHETHQDERHVAKLLFESPYELSFNEHKYQKLKRNINTCGRHCAMRVLFKNMPLKEYNNMMYSTELTPDQLVSVVTTALLDR